jgi:molybdopterin-containing oxidoreductase family iron-sulfur binding subunit
MSASTQRYGLVVDLDLCDGCGACTIACAVENNVGLTPPEADSRKGLTPLRVYRVVHEDRDGVDTAFVPLMCQQCAHHTPCVRVCPQNAVDVDPRTGVVSQIVDRCLGCRYCMTACPYHARYFNWWKPVWPTALENTLSPEVPVRMRGVVEKCNLCHGRLQRAQDAAAAEGRRELDLEQGEFVPACVEVCPKGALSFGDLSDKKSAAGKRAAGPRAFHLLEHLGTDPATTYLSSRPWVRHIDREETFLAPEEVGHDVS